MVHAWILPLPCSPQELSQASPALLWPRTAALDAQLTCPLDGLRNPCSRSNTPPGIPLGGVSRESTSPCSCVPCTRGLPCQCLESLGTLIQRCHQFGQADSFQQRAKSAGQKVHHQAHSAVAGPLVNVIEARLGQFDAAGLIVPVRGRGQFLPPPHTYCPATPKTKPIFHCPFGEPH